MALTARPSLPRLGAARAQGWLAAGRWPRSTRAGSTRAGWPCVVCVSTRPASTRPAPGLAGRAAPGLAGRVSCVPLWLYGTHGTHMRPCVSCGHVCHHFQIEVARQTWKSYTIHTVIIYSIYIFKRPIHLMTHMTHKGAFSESRIRGTPSPTTSPTPTHTY